MSIAIPTQARLIPPCVVSCKIEGLEPLEPRGLHVKSKPLLRMQSNNSHMACQVVRLVADQQNVKTRIETLRRKDRIAPYLACFARERHRDSRAIMAALLRRA